jgi:hypothetical protein
MSRSDGARSNIRLALIVAGHVQSIGKPSWRVGDDDTAILKPKNLIYAASRKPREGRRGEKRNAACRSRKVVSNQTNNGTLGEIGTADISGVMAQFNGKKPIHTSTLAQGADIRAVPSLYSDRQSGSSMGDWAKVAQVE